MAQSLVKLTPMYGNRYEAAYDKFVHNRWFDNQKWSEFAMSKDSTDLDMYIDALSKSDSINMDKYKAAYNSDYEDSRTKLLALYNEIYKDTDNFTYVDITDDSGETKRMKMSMYEYNRMAISDQNLLNKKLQEQSLAEEDDFGDFMKKLPADVASVVARVGYSAGNQATGLVALFPTLFKTVKDGISTGEWNWISNWDKYFFDLYDIEIEGYTIRDYLDYMDQEYGHFRDEDGNLTTPGRWLTGAAETVGSMLGSVALTYGISSAAGAIGKLAGISAPKALGQALGTFVYYAPISMESASQTKQYFQGQGISMSESIIMTEQLVKTAVEIGIEQGLGKIFGRTGQDIFTYGGKSIKGAPKALTKAGFFLDRGKDILQEAGEEVLQEMSGVAVDNLAGLLGKVFPTVINENFGEISNLSWQSIADAAIVAAIVSGGHSIIRDGLGVLSTESTIIKNGTDLKYLGKFESYLNKLNMSSYMEAYTEAQRLLTNELKKTSKLLPSESRLKELEAKRESILRKSEIANKELIDGEIANSIGKGLRASTPTNQTLPRITADQIVAAGGEISDREAYNKQFNTDTPVDLGSLNDDLKKVDDEIAEVKQALENETTDSKLNDLTNKKTVATRKRLAQAFLDTYSSFRMLEAFTNRVGKERIEAAEAILNKATEYIESGKFDKTKIEKDYNELIETIQLSGVEIPVTLKAKIKDAGMRELVKIAKRKGNDGSYDDVYGSDETKEQFNKNQKELETLFKASKKTDVIIITKEGLQAVADENIMVVPEKEFNLGDSVILENLAERTLAEQVLNGELKGITADKLIVEYKSYMVKKGETYTDEQIAEKAAYALLYDTAFFAHMLSTANKDTVQFLVSLAKLEGNLKPDDVKNAKYKRRVTTTKNKMVKILTQYVMYQPRAYYLVDFMTNEQKDEMIRLNYGHNAVVRFVEKGSDATNDVKDYLIHKIENLPVDVLSKADKGDLINIVNGKTSSTDTERQSLVDNLAKYYDDLWYDGYDGTFYLPTNSTVNKALNVFLYSQGLTTDTLMLFSEEEYDIIEKLKENQGIKGNVTTEDLLAYRNFQLQSKLGSNYRIELTNEPVDANNGVFLSGLNGAYRLKIVLDSSVKGKGFDSITDKGFRSLDSNDSGAFIATQSQTDLIKQIVNDAVTESELAALTIDDVLSDVELLSDDLQKAIEDKYGTLTPETAYIYINDFLIEQDNGFGLTLLDDGTVVFAEYTDMDKAIIEDLNSDDLKGEVNLLSILNPDYVDDYVANYKIVFDGRIGKKTSARVNTETKTITIHSKYRTDVKGFRRVLAHELVHVYQAANKMNTGNDGDVLSKFDTKQRNKIIASVKQHLPELFGKGQSDQDIVNAFIYRCSGELAANMEELSEAARFYPILVKDNANKTISVTLPWGDSFTSEKASTKKSLDDSTLSMTNPGKTNIENVKTLFYQYVEDDDIRALGDKVFSVYESRVQALHGEQIPIVFRTNEEMIKLYSKGYVGMYDSNKSSEGYGISYNSNAFKTYLLLGKTDKIAYTILHEIIHSTVVLTTHSAMKSINDKSWNMFVKTGIQDPEFLKLSDEYKAALTLVQIFDNVKSKQDAAQGAKVEIYNLKNVDEFVAGLSNPDFRSYLKSQSLWQKVVNCIKRILGIFTDNALDAASKALNTILESEPSPSEIEIKETFAQEDTESETKVDKSVHVRSKGVGKRSYVGKRATKGTNLEAFAGRRISDSLQSFIMKAETSDYSGIDKDLLKKIKNGTLTTTDIMDYFYSTDGSKESDEVTFKLINDTIFHNKFIKSFKELDEYILTKTANYYAMRAIFREYGLMDKLTDDENPDLYELFVDLIEKNPSLKNKYQQISNRYWSGEIIDEKNLRRLWMQWFDGSVESAGYIAAVGKVAAYQAWKTASSGSGKTSSLSSNVGKGKDKESTLTLENAIPNKSDFDDFNSFVFGQEGFARLGRLREAARQAIIQEAIKEVQEGNQISRDELEKRISNVQEEANMAYESNPRKFVELYQKYVSDDEELAAALYARSLVKAGTGRTDDVSIEEAAEELKEAEELSKELLRPKKNVVNNIRSISRTIRANLNSRERKLFLKENSDLFDDDLSVKKTLYQDVKDNGVVRLKEESILLEIEERVRALSKDVRNGIYNDEKFIAYRNKMERKVAKLVNELAKKKSGKTFKTVTYNVVGEELIVDTTKELPLAVKRLLETEMTKTAKSTTQLLTNDTDVHVQMNMKTFIESNVNTLNALTQQEVNEIVDFYMTSEIMPNTNRAKLWTTVQQLMLGYLLKMNGDPMSSFTLSEEQVSQIEKRMEFMVSTAATMVSTWKNVLNDMKIANELGKAMLKVCDIELSTDDENDLIQAVASGDVNRIKSVKDRVYKNLEKTYKGRKRTIPDRLLRFERMAMLSGPGTWVRNQTSNVLVTGANRLSELLTSFLPQSKKAQKLKQYKIVGTKVESKYATFIKNSIVDNGLLELISDGLIKYDTRRSGKVTAENQLLQLVKNKLENELFDNASSAFKASQAFQKFIATMMSDKMYINKTMLRYLGKMMTEDSLDISNGLTTEVMDTIANAYVMASQDYMHRTNFWSKLEESFRGYLHKHFNPTAADGIFFMYKQVFPFAAASWNWFSEAWNYTPLGLAKGIIDLCRLEKTVFQMEEAKRKGEVVRSSRFADYMAKRKIGKGMIGTAGLIIGAILVAVGKAGIDRDDDKYKLKIEGSDGPIYIDISDIYGSTGMIVGMSIAQTFMDRKEGFKYQTFIDIVSNALNVMFLDSSFADLFNSFRSVDTFADYLLNSPTNVAGMFVPNFIKTLSSLFKKYNVKYSSGLLGQMERFAVNSFAPFSYLMPYKVNPYTGDPEIVNEGWFALNIVNKFTPVKVKNYNFGDAEKLAVGLGIGKGQLSGRYTVSGQEVNLDSTHVESLNMFYGKLNKKDLEDFMNNKTTYNVENADGKRVELKFSRMTEKQKAAVIERIMSNNSDLAKIYVLTNEYGYKYYASESEYNRLRKAGVVKNVYRKTNKLEGFVKVN